MNILNRIKKVQTWGNYLKYKEVCIIKYISLQNYVKEHHEKKSQLKNYLGFADVHIYMGKYFKSGTLFVEQQVWFIITLEIFTGNPLLLLYW